MLFSVSDFIRRQAKPWVILALLGLVLLFSTLIIPPFSARLEASSGGQGPIDLLYSYSPDQVYGMVAAYGDAGRAYYHGFVLSYDLAFPVIYSLFLSLLIAWLLDRGTTSASRLNLLNLLPLGAGLFDWMENIQIASMLQSFPQTPQTTAQLGSLFTSFKWGFSALSLLALLIAAGFALRGRKAR
jgi:hypothetical protein